MIETELIDDIVGWDVPNWWRAIHFWETFLQTSDLTGKTVLDIGGGPGGLSLFWALKGAEVVYSDFNEKKFLKAEELYKKYGVDNRVRYEVIDAVRIPYKETFDSTTFAQKPENTYFFERSLRRKQP